MSQLRVEICKVEKVEKHPNADKLDIVSIKGWNCIVSLGQYKVGDLVIYAPPDSVIPDKLIEKHNLEFLKKNGKVGTIKLRKIVSQGLILDISDLPSSVRVAEGIDVAEALGITKWEPPEPQFASAHRQETFSSYFDKLIRGEITLRRFTAKSFGLAKDRLFKRKRKLNPLFDVYTDIENFKNFPNVFKEGEIVVITEKIHGTNVRYGNLPKAPVNGLKKFWSFGKNKYEFCYGSHRVQLVGNRGKRCFYGDDVYGRIAERLDLANKLPQDYVFYGEIYGKGIQDLTYGLVDDISVRFFDVKDTKTGKYLDYASMVELAEVYNNLGIVPVLYVGPYSKEVVQQYTNGKSILSPGQMREGIVIKPVNDRIEHMGRVILKSISEEYLLRKGGTENH